LPTSYRNTFITTIASKAFNQAKTLTNVVIPNTYKKIENAAFFLCDNIESITVPFVGETATSSKSWFGWIFGATEASKQYALLPLALNTVNIAEGATRVDSAAFYNCDIIENFNFPSSLKSIGSNAFYNCKKLTEFTISDNLTSLGSSVFAASGLTRVNASSIDKVFSLGESPFANGADLYIKGKLIKEVTIPIGLTTINCALSGSSVTKVIIPDGATTIGYRAFSGCKNLTNVIIPDSVTRIYSNAFSYCEKLTSIEIPQNVVSIGSDAFSYCDSLTKIVIPDGITSIASYTFSNCSNLTNVVIPDGVTAIGSYAFAYCERLISIEIPQSVISINNGAFSGCKSLTEMVIPEGVTNIASSVFQDCTSLTEITIPAYVYSIDSYAFGYCSNLAKITILSQRLTTINSNAFNSCVNLWEIYNLSTLEFTLGSNDYGYIAKYAKVIHTSLDETACVNITEDGFITYSNGEENLLYDYMGKGGDIVLPESINGNKYSINRAPFYGNTTITSVVIPENVISIGDNAFADCSSLTSVYYKGTAEKWSNISIGSYNSDLTSATRYYYSETTPALNADGTAYDGNYWHYDTDGITPVVWVYNKDEL